MKGQLESNAIATIVLFVFLLALSASVSAAPVQWSTVAGGNGHFYEVVAAPGGISWDDAQNAAVSMGGYLTTITSPAENSFVFGLVSGDSNLWYLDQFNNGIGPWLGGLQAAGAVEPGGGWEWVNGEGAFTYTNWEQFNPDNFLGIESRLQFFGRNTLIADTWNDHAPNTPVLGYIVEYDALVSIPATGWLLAFGLLVSFRRKAKMASA